MKALSKQFMVLNLKRWPKDLDRLLKIEAAKREVPKYELIERAVRAYLGIK